MRRWEQVAATLEVAASTRRDGKFAGFETVAKYASPELAYVVEVEQLEAKVHGGEDYCRENIARFKVPHYVHFVEDYPMTASAKRQRERTGD